MCKSVCCFAGWQNSGPVCEIGILYYKEKKTSFIQYKDIFNNVC